MELETRGVPRRVAIVREGTADRATIPSDDMRFRVGTGCERAFKGPDTADALRAFCFGMTIRFRDRSGGLAPGREMTQWVGDGGPDVWHGFADGAWAITDDRPKGHTDVGWQAIECQDDLPLRCRQTPEAPRGLERQAEECIGALHELGPRALGHGNAPLDPCLMDCGDAAGLGRASRAHKGDDIEAQLMRAQGFAIPETLLTNDPELMRAFHAKHRRVIYKSMSGVRSIVQTLEESDFVRLDHIRWCPTQFQAFVEGTNIRVHTVSTAIFATAIHTEATDYRYAQRQGIDIELQAIDLPDALAERCL